MEKLDIHTSDIWIERVHRLGNRKLVRRDRLSNSIVINTSQIFWEIVRNWKILTLGYFRTLAKKPLVSEKKWKELLKNRKDGKISHLQNKTVILKWHKTLHLEKTKEELINTDVYHKSFKLIFSPMNTKFRLISQREKCPNTEFFLVRIFPLSDWIQRDIRGFFWSVFSRIRTEYGEIRSISPYSVRMWENTDERKLRIWTLFTQCISTINAKTL